MTFFKDLWQAIKEFFGVGEEERKEEIIRDYRNKLTKERLAYLGEVIDDEVETLKNLETRWQENYENVSAYIRKRDERDEQIRGKMQEAREHLDTLLVITGENGEADGKKHTRIKTVYEESRFYVGMAENLEDLLGSHRARISDIAAELTEAKQTIAGFSGITLQAAMLSARFGEDAKEFASLCDKIMEQTEKQRERIERLESVIQDEEISYADTFEQAKKLTEQMMAASASIGELYDGEKEQRTDDDALREHLHGLLSDIGEITEETDEAKEINRTMEEKTTHFRALDIEEEKSRRSIESVANEIQNLLAE